MHKCISFSNHSECHKLFFLRCSCLCCIIMYLTLWFIDNALCEDLSKKYPCDQVPQKIALVIGNKNYVNLPLIESAATDGDQMRKRLTELGFEVTYVPDVINVKQFEYRVLKVFQQKIKEGAFVVVYFSGHGFSYGPNSFLAPTQIQKPIVIENDDNLGDYAISVDALKGMLATRDPGVIIIFVDACRSLGDFVIKDKENRNIISKGPPWNPRNHDTLINSFIFYAAQAGETAEGVSTHGQLSPFTEAINRRIATKGKSVSSVFRDIAMDVLIKTRDKQNPGSFDWSKTDPYFNPNLSNLNEEEEVWDSVRSGKDFEQVLTFSRRYSVSHCAASARKWLTDNVASSYTYVSPAAIDRAWRSQRKDRVGVLRTAGALGFNRTMVNIHNSGVERMSDSEIGLVKSGKTSQPVDSLAFARRTLIAHKDVVATQDIKAQTSPDNFGNGGEEIIIPAGANIEIKDVTIGADKQLHLTAATSNQKTKSTFVLSLPEMDMANPLDLGHSVKKIMAKPRKGNKDLVEKAKILAAVSSLKKKGWKISWVSLATASSNDEEEQNARMMRLANAKYILKEAGVEGGRITAVSGVTNFSGGKVRIHFFGYK